MATPDLRVIPVPGLELKDPFMIASSHWTATEAVYRQLSQVSPAALTLKTTSMQGGDGKESSGKREKRDLKLSSGHLFAKYTDGPKELELWDAATTYEMSRIARQYLPDTKLGLSVLKGEDYKKIASMLDMGVYGYVELNWKYAFRAVAPDNKDEDIGGITSDLQAFLDCFSSLPCIVKLPRESIPFLDTTSFENCLDVIGKSGAGLLVANSRRLRVPPSKVSLDDPAELKTGVVVGEYLFIETFDTLRRLSESDAFKKLPFPLLATGGVMDAAGVLDTFAAGANAVQLCTALDVRGPQVVELLREQLHSICASHGSLQECISFIRKDERHWQQSIVKARQAEVSDQDSVAATLQTSSSHKPILHYALMGELGSLKEATKEPDAIDLPGEFRFVVNYANVGAYYLASQCISKHRIGRIEAFGVREFGDLLAQGEFSYDFVIVPASAVDSLNRPSEILGSRKLNIIGEIGRSVWEIVGDKRFKDPLKTVYHFGGRSSRHVLTEFLFENESKPDTQKIDPPKLLPLLRFWHSDTGILAKPPLSRFYGLLANKEISQSWDARWKWSEPLLLACSQGHSDMHGCKYSDYLLAWLRAKVSQAIQNPEASLDELLATDFLNHCVKLVQLKKSK